MDRHASEDNHHELSEVIAQLNHREQVLISENDQLRAQLVEMKQQENKKYDDLMVQYNIKREYEDDGLDNQGTSNNQVTVKTEWNDEEVKQEIKVEIKEKEDDGIFIKQEYVSAYIKTESDDVKVEIKEEIKEEDDHSDDCGHNLRLVKKEEVSDDDDNSMQLDEVIPPNLAEPKDIVSRDQVNRPMQSVFELSPSANCQMQLTNSSQIEQSVDQQVDKADHEPNEPANHGHNQWPATKQSQSRTRKRTAMTSGQVSMNGLMTNSKRTRVETELDRTETVQKVSTAVALGQRQVDEESGGGEGLGQIEDDDDETELGEEDQGGHYKIEIVKMKCTEDGCEDEVADTDKLHDHLRAKHHKSPFRCLAVECNERFEQWNGLGPHVQNNHSNISTWPCSHCTKTFKTHNLLYKHLHLYHFKGQFKCGYDGCHYDRVGTLRSEILCHQLSVHPKSTIFTCQFNNCDKSFNKKYNFDCHQRIHQGVKPFNCTCDMCGYSATKQSDVIRHIRTQHFHLPKSQKKQHQLGIEDNRNPRDYLQKEFDN